MRRRDCARARVVPAGRRDVARSRPSPAPPRQRNDQCPPSRSRHVYHLLRSHQTARRCSAFKARRRGADSLSRADSPAGRRIEQPSACLVAAHVRRNPSLPLHPGMTLQAVGEVASALRRSTQPPDACAERCCSSRSTRRSSRCSKPRSGLGPFRARRPFRRFHARTGHRLLRLTRTRSSPRSSTPGSRSTQEGARRP
jgi:hypothetical protein